MFYPSDWLCYHAPARRTAFDAQKPSSLVLTSTFQLRSRYYVNAINRPGTFCGDEDAGRINVLLFLVGRPLTAHPNLDGAPFLFLVETSPKGWAQITLLPCTIYNRTPVLSPSCVAADGDQLSLKIASVLSGHSYTYSSNSWDCTLRQDNLCPIQRLTHTTPVRWRYTFYDMAL